MAEGQAQSPPTSSIGPAEKPEVQAASDGRDGARAADDRQLLLRVLKNTAGLMELVLQSQKSAQVAYSSTMEALSHLKGMLDLSCNIIQFSLQLLEHFSDQRGRAGVQELFQEDPELSVTYNTFLRTLQEAEEDLPPLRSGMKTAHTQVSCACGLSSPNEDEDEPDTEKKSHHIQVERVRSEEYMKAAYVTQRRRSPRRSRSAGAAGLSPLLSEEESSIQPVIQSPNRRCSTGKIVHRECSENWDSGADRSPRPAPSFNPEGVP